MSSVHELINETGATGHVQDLETGKELGTKPLGPWKIKMFIEITRS